MRATVTVMLKNGVLDPQGKAIGHALNILGFASVGEVRAGKVFELDLTETDPGRRPEPKPRIWLAACSPTRSSKASGYPSMRSLLVLPILLLAAAPARADWTPLSAKILATLCHATDVTKHAQCLGYVSGINDLQLAPKLPAGVCPPANLDAELLAEVVTAYLDTHEDGHPLPGRSDHRSRVSCASSRVAPRRRKSHEDRHHRLPRYQP